MSDTLLRTKLIRLASTLPKGSADRRQVLELLKTSGFDAAQIGETVDGPLEIVEPPVEAWMDGEFTQQENIELLIKQEEGILGDGEADEGPMRVAALRSKLIRVAHEHKALRQPILKLLKDAGCEKLPEGGMRDNCEAKKEEGKENDKKDDKKAAAKEPAKLKGKKLDDAVNKAFYKHGDSVQFDIMDLGKLSNDVKKAYEAGEDMDEAMKKAVAKYRKN